MLIRPVLLLLAAVTFLPDEGQWLPTQVRAMDWAALQKRGMTLTKDQFWHPDCFVCFECSKPFPDRAFFQHDSKPYCADDYCRKFAAQCAGCGEYLLDTEVAQACDASWHPHCLVCSDCRRPLEDAVFRGGDGKPYCAEHYQGRFVPKCPGCGLAAEGTVLKALEGTWHPACFTCVDCGERAYLIQAVAPGDVAVGDIVSYRCSACLVRWDVELTEEDVALGAAPVDLEVPTDQ